MTDLERRYRLLLLAFPRRYRDRRGDEMVGTIMDSARPGQRWPHLADAADLVNAGLSARTRLSAESGLGSVLGLAAPYGLAVAGGIASACLVFGELKVPGIWHRGFEPNQFSGGRFETNAVPFYVLALLASAAMVAGRLGVARVLAVAGCVAAYVSLNTGSLRGGSFHPPVDLVALLFLALLPAVVAPAAGRSLKGVVLVAVALVAGAAAVNPARAGADTRASFYADLPSTVSRARLPFAIASVLIVAALVILAVRRHRWQMAAAAGLVVPPLAGLLAARPVPSQFVRHYVLLVAFLEVLALMGAAVLGWLGKEFVVTRRREGI